MAQIRAALLAQAQPSVQQIREQRAQEAILRWRSAPKGKGSDAFFQLAVDLRGAGLNHGEIGATLGMEAGFARSPRERRADISGILRRLRSKRHL